MKDREVEMTRQWARKFGSIHFINNVEDPCYEKEKRIKQKKERERETERLIGARGYVPRRYQSLVKWLPNQKKKTLFLPFLSFCLVKMA